MIFFVSANSVDPDEITHHAAFHLGLHCLQKYAFCDNFTSIQVVKTLTCNTLGQNFLLVDLREIFFRFRGGGRKK